MCRNKRKANKETLTRKVIIDLENRSRRDNVCVDRLEELDKECREQASNILQQILNDKLHLIDAQIERQYRVEQKVNSKHEPQ